MRLNTPRQIDPSKSVFMWKGRSHRSRCVMRDRDCLRQNTSGSGNASIACQASKCRAGLEEDLVWVSLCVEPSSSSMVGRWAWTVALVKALSSGLGCHLPHTAAWMKRPWSEKQYCFLTTSYDSRTCLFPGYISLWIGLDRKSTRLNSS